MRLIARPLDAAAFAPYGTVVARPASTGPTLVAPVGPAENLRPESARAGVAWFAVAGSAWPVIARVMERHRFSSQGFVPSGAADWLVLVAPHDAGGGPDMARAVAFVASGEQAVTFAPDTWHHPLTAFAPAQFAVLTFLAGDSGDEEFRTLATPVEILPR